MRHATAAEKEAGQTDSDRVLTLFGERQAGQAGLWLVEQQLVPQLVLCSPAVRTRHTWEQAEDALPKKVPIEFENDLYLGTEHDIQSIVQGVHEDVDTLLVVGHNPTIAFLAAMLLQVQDEELAFRPATLVWLQYSGSHWRDLRAKSCKLMAKYVGQ